MKYFILNIIGLLICLALIFVFETERKIYDFYRSEILKRLFNDISIMVSNEYKDEFKANVDKISKLGRIEFNDLGDFASNIEKMRKQSDELKSNKDK